jgi:hypothetical protein
VWGWERGKEPLGMSPANKNALISIAASIFMLIGVFAKPLHIPSPWDIIPLAVAGVCFYLITPGLPSILTLVAKKRRFWLFALAFYVISIGCIPLMPYMVKDFSSTLYFYVVPADIIFVSLILFFFWKKLIGPLDSLK